MFREPGDSRISAGQRCGRANDGESCIEVATTPATAHVRDSKDLGGPQLALTPTAWTGFLSYAIGD
ncbi:DUF397 domain-containing protein [Streptomyces sp. PvR006]|uniref:DUF397 domain-containing protein n=1 Tax=Streptomyces sp. PvR006 TaxID=2817860 RepID=UPI001AEB7C6D|nr:DUF397 domain-containing protein [Streptomyces sp. PvR006]